MKKWLQALRVYSFTASLGPIILVTVITAYQGVQFSYFNLLLVVIGLLALHSATNLVNDYFDYKYQVDHVATQGSSRVLVDKVLAPQQLKMGFIFLYFLVVLIGGYFTYLRGWLMLSFILAGLLGSYFYTAGRKALKYLALGELSVFLLMGPLMMAAIYLALTGMFHQVIWLISIPVGLLTIAILSANNLRDYQDDKRSNINTLATVFGKNTIKVVLVLELMIPYLLISVYAWRQLLPLLSLLIWLSAPATLKQLLTAISKEQLPPKYVENCAQLQLIFVLLLVLSHLLEIMF